MKKIRVCAILMIIVYSMSMAAQAAAGFAPQQQPASTYLLRGQDISLQKSGGEASEPPPPVDLLPGEEVLAKIEPALQEQILAGGEEPLLVLALAAPGTDLSRVGDILSVIPDPTGMERILLQAQPGLLYKLASHPDVLAVTGFEGVNFSEPPDPLAPGLEQSGATGAETASLPQADAAWLEQRRAAMQQSQVVLPGVETLQVPEALSPDSPQAPEHWYENDTQGVVASWVNGFLGTGDPGNNLKIAIVDTGVDFCNPSLMGRWATEWGGTPWDGWPIAYDDRSASEFVVTYPAPGSGVNGNWGWYVNASFPVIDTPPGTPTLFVDPLYNLLVSTPGTSLSGMYWLGYHPDTLWNILGPTGSPAPLLLVADPNIPGVYDTVYVDSNWNFQIGDPADVAMTMGNPAGCADWTGPGGAMDGVADDSWGLLYWISDGINFLPGVSTVYGGSPIPPPGQVLMFMINDVYDAGGNHGTLCASSAAGYDANQLLDAQGILASFYLGQSIVAGPGSGGPFATPLDGARIIPMGNIYAGGNLLNNYYFTAFGYDNNPLGIDDPQIVSMSYGDGGEDADAWDFQSEYLSAINLTFEQLMGLPGPIYVSSAGNGGHGYGTVNTPAPVTGVQVGAATQYGPYNVWGYYEGISQFWQANYQDVQPFSGRGPTAMSSLAPHVIANGAWGSGAIPLNEATWVNALDGTAAWTMWGGSSRSTPVTSGMLALIYDAYFRATGTYPGWRLGRELLMSGATGGNPAIGWLTGFHYDEKVGGAGQAYAWRSTNVANGAFGVYVDPPFYDAGTSHVAPLNRYESFAHGLLPGEVDVVTFTVNNPSAFPIGLELWDEQLQEINRYPIDLTIPPDMASSNYTYGAPDYLVDLTPFIQQNAGADLMIVRVAYPFEHFAADPFNAPNYQNMWIGAIYNVFDDGNGMWWNDLDLDGRVDISPTMPLPAHELDPNDEHIRLTYSYLEGTEQEMRMRDPTERGAGPYSGASSTWLGLSHYISDGAPVDLRIEVIFYAQNDWEQVSVEPIALTVPAGTPIFPGQATFTATIAAWSMGLEVFGDDFEAPGPWIPSGLWHPQSNTACVFPPSTSPTTAMAFNLEGQCDYNTGVTEQGYLMTAAPIPIPAGVPVARLVFWSYEDTECNGTDYFYCGFRDLRTVEASRDGVNWDLLWTSVMGSVEHTWYERAVDLNPYIGEAVFIRFGFDSVDAMNNAHAGWYIDDVRIQIPIPDDDYGEHMGRIVLEDFFSSTEPFEVVVPVQKQVWFETGLDPVLGGTPAANTPYDNGYVYGAMSWGGRSEVGDWRFFPFLVDEGLPAGSVIVVDNQWQDDPTDIDSLILAPTGLWNLGLWPSLPHWFGPYTLDDLGYGSDRLYNISRPNWKPGTNLGATHEFVTAPADHGLHVLAHHTVLYGGELAAVPFTTTVGIAGISPSPVELNGITCISCTVPLHFKSGVGFPEGLVLGGAYGWFQPMETVNPINAGESQNFPLPLAANYSLEIETWDAGGAEDVDLYLWQDGGNGVFDGGTIDDIPIAASYNWNSDEHIRVYGLADGLYFIEVFGRSVSGSPGYYGLRYRELSQAGGVMSVEGLPGVVEADTPYTLTLHMDAPPPQGTWEGLLLFGPSHDPQMLEIPVIIYQGQASKTAWQDTVEWGDLITYTIAITAAAGAPTNTYQIVDEIPDGAWYHSVQGAVYSGTIDAVLWEGILENMEQHAITLTVQAVPDGQQSITNTAWIYTDWQACPISDTVQVIYPEWQKVVNGQLWVSPTITITAQTSDTIVVEERITTTQWVHLFEFWDPAHLDRIGTQVSAGWLSYLGPGGLLWEVPPTPGGVVTITKEFHVEPCTWTVTLLTEELYIEMLPYEQRSVVVEKMPADLWIGAAYDPQVWAGQQVTFTLDYGNLGGYENNVVISNTFPAEAPFVTADPWPDLVDVAGRWAVWWVGDLAEGSAAQITVTVAVTETASPSDTITVWDGIYDHTGELSDEVWLEFHVEPTGWDWQKEIWLGGDGPYGPADSPFGVIPGDAVTIVDRIWLTAPVTIDYLELVETWDASLVLSDVVISQGAIITSAAAITWTVQDAPPLGWIEITKTFEVAEGVWETDLLTETLEVFNADPQPGAVVLAFEHLWPDITLNPLSFDVTLAPGASANRTLTIGNAGGATLHWSLAENPAVSWLGESQVSGALLPGNNLPLTLAFNATGLAEGDYTTTLHITSDDPDEALLQVPVTLHVQTACIPVAGASFTYNPTNPLAGQAVTFSGAVTAGDAPITYAWSFGDGGTATGQSVNHTFALSGTYNVVMTATNCSGAEVSVDTQDVTVVTEVEQPEADLEVDKTAPASARIYDEITYEIVVTNDGPDEAVNVLLTDTLPDGVTFVSASEGCVYADGVVTCDLGDLAAGGSVTVHIVVEAPGTGASILNEAEVASDTIDPDLDNNIDTAETTLILYLEFYLPMLLK